MQCHNLLSKTLFNATGAHLQSWIVYVSKIPRLWMKSTDLSLGFLNIIPMNSDTFHPNMTFSRVSFKRMVNGEKSQGESIFRK